MVLHLVREFWWISVPFAAAAIGMYIDKQQSVRYSGLKNKTKLFERELKPGEDAWK